MYEFSKLCWTSERPEFFEIEMLNKNLYKIEFVRELYKSFENQSYIKKFINHIRRVLMRPKDNNLQDTQT